ncbi:Hypothetical predicted protein [Mytilus galloprovincialis]|uniref:Uncharacterized protein n=1 Tax=Mytilus galloprovincialis TaxID=29158 RepID=A0A8B6FJS7_MYTGA|nr:Hypothetical predicted protein [Mytilus galloprovincialis]
MLLGSFLCICTILPLLVALHNQNEYVPVVLKDCYSYENMDNFLTMGTLEQIRCLQQYMLTSNNGIIQHKLNDLLRIPISITYLQNGGKHVLDSLPKFGSKIYDQRPQFFEQLMSLIKNRAKRSVKHKSKYGHTHHSPAELEQIARDIVRDSSVPKITDSIPHSFELY